MHLLDTSIAVDHLRGRRAATDLLVRLTETGRRIGACELVRFELLAGMRPAESAGLERFFQTLDWWPVNEEIARVAGRLARLFRRSHSGIDAGDYLIAATALVLDAKLLTLNVRHFPMFPGLSPPY